MPFGRTVFPLTTTGSAMLAINVSPALLVSVPTASIIATVSVVPAGISTISGGGAADDFGAAACGVADFGTADFFGAAAFGEADSAGEVSLARGAFSVLPGSAAGGVLGACVAGWDGVAGGASCAGRLQAIKPIAKASAT